MADPLHFVLDSESRTPLYKQLAEVLEAKIASGRLSPGDRLPPTRELAGMLGLNRTTVSAAYTLLEESGLIAGQVGRGSYVARRANAAKPGLPSWDAVLPPLTSEARARTTEISFASSRPAEEDFPLDKFRQIAREVIDSLQTSEILQLGSAYGYPPLRQFLLEHARDSGLAREGDDVIVTNGCQQALDLLARLFVRNKDRIVLEDPCYHGLLKIFTTAQASVVSVPAGNEGIDLDWLERSLQEAAARLMVLTPTFQNPTGLTMPMSQRRRVLEIAERYGVAVVENDMYSELRYRGEPIPPLKWLDTTGQAILLRSYSKVSFPGLRVGWVIAPRPIIARLAELKQMSDLHSDQLSQAILLRFAQSGELDRHIERTKVAGLERLHAAISCCEKFLPQSAKFTKPDGGMNLWVELPGRLTAEALLDRVEAQGVTFMPGRYFSDRSQHRGLRLSFGGLSPEQIHKGIRILGETATAMLAERVSQIALDTAVALV